MQDSAAYHLLAGIAIAIVMIFCFTIPASGYLHKDLYVLLMTKDCDDQTMLFAETLFALPSHYDAYLDYQNIAAVCLGGVTFGNLADALPLMRHAYPDAHFLFVYDIGNNEQFKSYVSSQGYSGKGSFYGQAFVKEGYALSTLDAYTMQHEAAHISTCLFHNEESDPVEKWYAPREAALSRFCR